jgi:predicted nucleic acid-binding protein
LSRIFFDTNLFIYLVEEHKQLGPRVHELLARMIERRDELVTSTLTIGEVLVKPLSVGRPDLAERYEQMIDSPGMVLVPFDRACARLYAQIRCNDKTIKGPDAIQLASAAQAKSDLFITNDERLSRKIVPGIQFITSIERAFL